MIDIKTVEQICALDAATDEQKDQLAFFSGLGSAYMSDDGEDFYVSFEGRYCKLLPDGSLLDL